MFPWEAVTAIFTAFASLAVILAFFQLREMREAEKVHHLVEEGRLYKSESFMTYRRKLAQERVDQRSGSSSRSLRPLSGSDAPAEMYVILDFFNHVGLLLKRGYLDPTDAWDEFGYPVVSIYADARPVIEYEQKADPNNYKDLEYLLHVVQAVEGDTRLPSQEDIVGFYSYELDLPTGNDIARRKKGH